MYDPKGSVNYSNEMTPQGYNNNDETQVEDRHQNINMNRAFNYLEIDNSSSSEKFIFEGSEKTNIFESIKSSYDYIICILLEDDSYQSSDLLDRTLKGIYENFSQLQDIGIGSSNTLICIFIKEIMSFSLFNTDDIQNSKIKEDYYLYKSTYKRGYNSSSIYLFTKPRGSMEIESLRCFYLGVISQLKEDKKILFASVITAGVEPTQNSLKRLILSSYDTQKDHGVSVGLIQSTGNGIFSMIEQYERTHFNLYNMNFYGMSAVVPISSLFSTITIYDKTLPALKNFYSFAIKNQTIDYHDYNLALHLFKQNINIKFYSEEPSGILITNDLKFCDYQEIWVNRYSGYYGNFFDILGEFINFGNFNIFKKLILLFHIIGILIEFIYPALSSMVIYSIFYEAFGSSDYRLATFFTMLYIFMLAASGLCSLVSKKPREMEMTNFFLYIFMEVYYLFILICSVVAMDRVNKNKTKDEYKFNKAAISFIIILTFIPYIIPMLLKSGVIISNIVNMLIYIGLGASCSTSNFLMAEVFNAAQTPGGEEIDERKGIVLIIFFLYNLFFGCLTFYNYNRRKRVVCVMGFGIFYLIYNFFKIIGIIFKLLSKDDAVNSNKNRQIVEGIKSDIGKDADDFRNEEKRLKGSNQYYSENGNDNENDNENYNENNSENNNDNNFENNDIHDNNNNDNNEYDNNLEDI